MLQMFRVMIVCDVASLSGLLNYYKCAFYPRWVELANSHMAIRQPQTLALCTFVRRIPRVGTVLLLKAAESHAHFQRKETPLLEARSPFWPVASETINMENACHQ